MEDRKAPIDSEDLFPISGPAIVEPVAEKPKKKSRKEAE